MPRVVAARRSTHGASTYDTVPGPWPALHGAAPAWRSTGHSVAGGVRDIALPCALRSEAQAAPPLARWRARRTCAARAALHSAGRGRGAGWDIAAPCGSLARACALQRSARRSYVSRAASYVAVRLSRGTCGGQPCVPLRNRRRTRLAAEKPATERDGPGRGWVCCVAIMWNRAPHPHECCCCGCRHRAVAAAHPV
jgi:hypothetical protein